jgi:hypothetical protein
MSNADSLEFVSHEEWRLWIEENHSSETEFGSAFKRKNPKGLKYEDAVEDAFCNIHAGYVIVIHKLFYS